MEAFRGALQAFGSRFVSMKKAFLGFTHDFIPISLLGWVREVVYKQQADGTYDQGNPPTIVYHAPRRMPGTKPRQFRNIGELQSYRKLHY